MESVGLGCLQLCPHVIYGKTLDSSILSHDSLAVQCGPCFYQAAILQSSMGRQHDPSISLSYYDAVENCDHQGNPA